MDSWSRPSKSSATPPPLYLTVGDTVPYCHSCGRVIGSRKTNGPTEVKYCSQRCRNNKPGPTDRKIEAAFAKLLDGAAPESLFTDAAEEEDEKKKKDTSKNNTTDPSTKPDTEPSSSPFREKKSKKKAPKSKATPSHKGDHRILLECSALEEIFFQRAKDPEKTYGRRKNRRARFVVEAPEDWRSVDMVDAPPAAAAAAAATAQTQAHEKRLSSDAYDDDSTSASDSEPADDDSGGVVLESTAAGPHNNTHLADAVEYGYGSGKIRPPQAQNDVNGSVGGEKGWAERQHETDEAKAKRREGQRRADEREMVRKAARRGCAFGFVVGGAGDGERRKCEAVMKGVVVEASFAKGEGGIRWREKV
jgi:hypothetical protein